MKVITTKNVNPVAEVSKVINVSATSFPENKKEVFYTTLMLWKRSGVAWTDNELMPVTKMEYSSKDSKITIFFSGGDKKVINFE